jgi:hypothetical protein
MRSSAQDFLVNNTQPEIKYYTTHQYHEFIDNEESYRLHKNGNKVFAKAVDERLTRDIRSNIVQTKYYVRGINGKKLFDPFPKYSISDNKSSFIDKVCKDDHNFLEVTKSIFDKYITFLNTESRQYFTTAQREIM